MERLTLAALLAMPPLARDLEQALARSARGGDLQARAELIRLSLRLVALRASSLRVGRRDLDDALQAGTVGLIGAIDRFDPDRGVRLATYAWPWITAAIRASVRSGPDPLVASRDPVEPAGGVIHELVGALPPRLRDVLRLRFAMGGPDGVPWTRAEVAAQLGLSVPQVRRAEEQALGRLRGRLARLGDRDPL